MELEDTDDQGLWVRPVHFKMVCPRIRPLPAPVPIVQYIQEPIHSS